MNESERRFFGVDDEWRHVRLQPANEDIRLCVSDVIQEQDPAQSGWWLKHPSSPYKVFYAVASVREAPDGGDVWPDRIRLVDVGHEPLDLTLAEGSGVAAASHSRVGPRSPLAASDPHS